MDAKSLKEITSELSLLYVEDDTDLREETEKLFGHLFKRVETANNGQVALDKLLNETFDLVISDINMPVMDGISLSKHIRGKFPEQTIIIISAHNESSYLLELIELGIDKFILKPIDMQKLINTLAVVCSNIMNTRLIDKYKQDLEASNLQLKSSNDELETLVKILDTKIKQLNKTDNSHKLELTTDKESDSQSMETASSKEAIEVNEEGLYLYKDYLLDDDFKNLKNLENDISAGTVLINLQESIEATNVIHLGNILHRYSEVLSGYPLFKTLANEITQLAQSLKKESSNFIKHSFDILVLLESFLYVLKKWRIGLFEKGIKSPHVYDASMINDIKTIIIILQKGHNS